MSPEELAELLRKNRQDRMRLAGLAPFPSKEANCADTVLLVDDDEDFRQTTRRLLEKQGYIVLVAAEASDLSKFIGQFPISIVLLDLHLPWINGIELCRYLRGTTGEIHRVPIVLVSGSHDQSVMKEAFAAGCDDFLVKPVDIEMLFRTVRNLMKISKCTP